MSSNEDERGRIRWIVKHPIAWVFGGIASVIGFFGAVLGDPIGSFVTIILTLIDLAMPIFTASSIAGFTLAPNIPQLPARELQIVAIVSGIVVVGLIADRVWDSIKGRVDDD